MHSLFWYRYSEVCDPGYDFTRGGFSMGTGHFSQVGLRTTSKSLHIQQKTQLTFTCSKETMETVEQCAKSV